MKEISGFKGYKISSKGQVYNKDGLVLKQITFKNTRYVRLSKKGKRYTLSVNKLLYETYNCQTIEELHKHIPLRPSENGVRYKESQYYITNHSRCYNCKSKKFLKPIMRNGYASYNLSIDGKIEVVFPLSYLRQRAI